MKVVGIGASAGGIKALSKFLQHLSPKTGAAFVIVQHLSPDFKSIMDDLLKKHTSMPLEIIHKDTFVKANHIYLMPGDKTITFEYGMLKLHPRRTDQVLNLPIDEFFHSLGRNLKSNSIGIILSGSGTDGSRGVRTIKEYSGLVLVESPESAEFDGMPNSVIRLNLADEILTPEELAVKLGQILAKEETALQHLEDKEDEKAMFEKTLQLLKNKVGIEYADYKMATLVRRLEKRMLLKNCDTLKEYYAILEKDDTEVIYLSNSFLIGVTRFYRDEAVFKYFSSTILPKIFDQVEATETVRIWIPACSTGEEAYTVAMLVDQYIKENNSANDFKIFASDVNKHAIDFAGAGIYDLNISADISKDLIIKYFTKYNDSFRVKKDLKEKIIFAVQNVVKDPPFIRMHFISCRNMLIYLKEKTQDKVLRTFYFALHPHFYLLLGPSESLGGLKTVFKKAKNSINLYQKKLVDLQKNTSSITPPPFWVEDTKTRIPGYKPKLPSFPPVAPKTPIPFANYLLEKHTPTTLFLNESLDIIYTHGNLDELLKLPRALSRLNLYKMLDKDPLLIFKDGVHKALVTEETYHYPNVIFLKKGKSIATNLLFQRVQLAESKEKLVEVEISRTNEKEQKQIIEVKKIITDHAEDEQINLLTNKLLQKEEEAKDLKNELELTNEELQTSNRELLASNEELQSTNEELQSLNEELYTVNSELQFKNKEISATFNDLNNLLKGTGIGTIFLSNDLKIRRFTPAVRAHFEIEESDINRTITSFAHNLVDVNVGAFCKQVLDNLVSYEKQVKDKEGHNFLLRILPYRTESDQIDGLVLTFVDIEELCTEKDKSELLTNRLHGILTNARSSITFVNATGDILAFNRPFSDFSTADLQQKNLFDLLPQSVIKTLQPALQKVLATKKTNEIFVKIPVKNTPMTNHFRVNMVPITQKDGNLESICVIWYDINAQVEQVEGLQKERDQYKNFIYEANHQLMLIDKAGIIKEINDTRDIEEDIEQMIGTSVYDKILKEEVGAFRKDLEKIFQGQGEGNNRLALQFIDEQGNIKRQPITAIPIKVKGVIEHVLIIGNPK